MDALIHLREDSDELGYEYSWCGEYAVNAGEVESVTCVKCLNALLETASRCSTRLAELTKTQEG